MGRREIAMAYSRHMKHDYIHCPRCDVQHLMKQPMFTGENFKCQCGCEFTEHLRHKATQGAV